MTNNTYITTSYIQANFNHVLKQDIIRRIPEYENALKLYFAHREGYIISVNRNLDPHSARILKTHLGNTVDPDKSYYRIHLSTMNDVPSHPFVHRLIAITFLNEQKLSYKTLQHMVVNHIDGDKHNNCVSNLEWTDKHCNLLHAYKIQAKKPNCVKYKVVNTKTNEIIVFDSRKQCASYFGVDKSVITNVARRYRYHGTLYRQTYVVTQYQDPVIHNFDQINAKPHPKFTNYFGTSDGRVVSLMHGAPKYIKPELTSSGYLNVTIQYNKKSCSYRVNKFIWECFHQQLVPDGYVIDHINGNINNDATAKLDNRIENLQLITQQQNVIHSCGKNVIAYMKDGRQLHFKTIKECANYFNVSSASIDIWINKRYKPNPKHCIERIEKLTSDN